MACPFVTNSPEKESKHSYNGYLKLDQLLNIQHPISWKEGEEKIHEEHLFVTVHQAYELWFKQMIIEVDSVIDTMTNKSLTNPKHKFSISTRLNRMKVIMELLVQQIRIIQTITDCDFVEFRKILMGSSGFDSFQFRILENKFGVREQNRIKLHKKKYTEVFEDIYFKNLVLKSEMDENLFDCVQHWLENLPQLEDFKFIERYEEEIKIYFQDMERQADLIDDLSLREDEKVAIIQKKKVFTDLFDEDCYEFLKKRGDKFLSQRAFLAVVMIWIFKDELPFIQCYTILRVLEDIDECFMKWRYNHALMAQGIIGTSTTGTAVLQNNGNPVVNAGGSSGYQYLRSTASNRYRVFKDLTNVAPVLIPRMSMSKEFLNLVSN